MEHPYRYISYLLRLWQTQDGGRLVWRCSLESPGTGERHGFANLQDLFDFLCVQTLPSLSQTSQDDLGQE